MIRYTGLWHEDAQNQLAEIWKSVSVRKSVTLAANAVDRHLATDAMTKGLAVEGDLWRVVVLPLRLLFAINEEDRMVRILGVTLP